MKILDRGPWFPSQCENDAEAVPSHLTRAQLTAVPSHPIRAQLTHCAQPPHSCPTNRCFTHCIHASTILHRTQVLNDNMNDVNPTSIHSFWFAGGGRAFVFCLLVAGWRHALRSEWPFMIINLPVRLLLSSVHSTVISSIMRRLATARSTPYERGQRASGNVELGNRTKLCKMQRQAKQGESKRSKRKTKFEPVHPLNNAHDA